MERRIYEILTTPRRDDRLGRAISLVLLLLVATSVVTSVIRTDVELAGRAPEFLRWFEIISMSVFTIEYVLRLWTCTKDPRLAGGHAGRLRHAATPMMLIDLLAIAPFYVELLLPGVIDLSFLRVMRLFRVFRIMRVGPFATAFTKLTRVIRTKRIELGVSMSIVAVAMLVAAGAIYMAEHAAPDSKFTSIPRAMWWSIVTITTVGYGDMTPVTPLGQIIGGVVAILGICAIALPVGIISAGYVDEINRDKTEVARGQQRARIVASRSPSAKSRSGAGCSPSIGSAITINRLCSNDL